MKSATFSTISNVGENNLDDVIRVSLACIWRLKSLHYNLAVCSLKNHSLAVSDGLRKETIHLHYGKCWIGCFWVVLGAKSLAIWAPAPMSLTIVLKKKSESLKSPNFMHVLSKSLKSPFYPCQKIVLSLSYFPQRLFS